MLEIMKIVTRVVMTNAVTSQDMWQVEKLGIPVWKELGRIIGTDGAFPVLGGHVDAPLFVLAVRGALENQEAGR